MQQTKRSIRPRIANSAFSIFRRDVIVYVTLFLTSIAIARILGPTEYGYWSILLLLPNYASALGRPMTDAASVYFIARKDMKVEDAASVLLAISITMWLVVLVMFLAGQGWLFDSPLRHFQDRQWLPLLMLFTALLNFLGMNYMYLMLAEEDIKGYNGYQVVHSALAPVLGVALLWGVGPDIKWLAWTLVAGNSAALLYGATRVHRRHSFRPRVDLGAMRKLLAFGSKQYLGSMTGFLSLNLAGGLIASYLSEEAVAFYQLALTRAFLLQRLASAIGTLLYPRIASFRDDVSGALAVFGTAMRVNVLLTGAAALALIAVADPMFGLLYGEQYSPAIIPFVIIVGGVAAESITLPVSQFFASRGKPLVPTVISAVVLIPQFIALVLIVPNGTVVSAAAVAAGAFAFGAVLRLLVITRMFDVRLTDLIVPGQKDVALVHRRLREIVFRGK